MKLDVSCMRYLSKDDFRVLTAIEMGMRNHELVPVELITQISRLRHGGSGKIMSTLLRYKLIAHEQNNYNGYRLSYLGYDILALHALRARGTVVSVGRQIGVGKESDIFEAMDSNGEELVIKIHRLGRTSFRSVRKNRDYMQNRSKASWLYMSRLAAIKEYAFMQALHEHGFPTPKPLDQSRHCVVMSRVNGFPMCQIKAGKLEGAESVFRVCVGILRRLAQYGLVHCDFNEFNLMIGDGGEITVIDFPQMVSTSHPNAKELFDRDMNCLIKFFGMKMHYIPPDEDILQFEDIVREVDTYNSAISAVGVEDDSVLLEYMSSNLDDGVDGDTLGIETVAEVDIKMSSAELDDLLSKPSDPLAVETSDSGCILKSDPFVVAPSEGEVPAASAAVVEDASESDGESDDGVLPDNVFEDIHAIVQREKLRRKGTHRGGGGTRNMSKKRTKYGKVDRSLRDFN